MKTQIQERNDFFELDQFNLRKEVITKLDKDFCYQNQAVVLQETGKGQKYALVGMLEPGNKKIFDRICSKLHCKVKAVQLNDYEITKALAFAFSDDSPDEEYVLDLRENREIHFNSEQEAKDILDDLLTQAIKMNATDVHIENYKDDVDLRYRIDGVLHQITTPLSPINIKKVTGRIKVMADLNVAEHRLPQDGKLKTSFMGEGGNRNLDIRVSVLPSPIGENIVLRILDNANTFCNINELGIAGRNMDIMLRNLEYRNGIILFTGPTGSGKTTSLYSVIKKINTPENKIITVEDPIEYEIPKVSQYQVNSRLGFADFAKAFLRHDPDVIVIGEIRDEETAELAIRASSTGHLVLSTMHTNDAVSVIGRFRDFGVPDSFVADNLRLSVSQRLFRKICPECEGKGIIKGNFEEKKCPECYGIGYKGRTGIFEVFEPDKNIRAMISDGRTLQEIRSQYPNSESLESSAREKITEGITNYEEMSRVVKLDFQE